MSYKKSEDYLTVFQDSFDVFGTELTGHRADWGQGPAEKAVPGHVAITCKGNGVKIF